jgi:excisionase family DNA binding protein
MDLITVKEAAQELRVSPVTIRRYIKSGRLRCIRLGRTIRLRREDVEGIAGPALRVEDDDEQLARIQAGFRRQAERNRRFNDALARGASVDEASEAAGWQPTSKDDPFWRIVGMIDVDLGEGSSNIHKTIADAYFDRLEQRRRK